AGGGSGEAPRRADRTLLLWAAQRRASKSRFAPSKSHRVGAARRWQASRCRATTGGHGEHAPTRRGDSPERPSGSCRRGPTQIVVLLIRAKRRGCDPLSRALRRVLTRVALARLPPKVRKRESQSRLPRKRHA